MTLVQGNAQIQAVETDLQAGKGWGEVRRARLESSGLTLLVGVPPNKRKALELVLPLYLRSEAPMTVYAQLVQEAYRTLTPELRDRVTLNELNLAIVDADASPSYYRIRTSHSLV